ncbi:MAG: hypothetical protein H5T50_02500 [Nitrososphaeria archaeon]|nr:hypothetical protein [Nitrososphaeria archaeon]
MSSTYSTHAYTPGLRVCWCTTLRKERRLPLPGEILVKKGENVTQDDIVARTQIPGEVQIVNAASILEIEPEEIERYMVKKLGEKVDKDEILAFRKGFFGLTTKYVRSPIKGKIEYLSQATGNISIRAEPTKIEIDAYIPGVVVDVLSNEAVTVETKAALIEGIFGIGGEKKGEIYVAVKEPSHEILPEDINENCRGKIIVGGATAKFEAIKKAIDYGAKGLIVGGLAFKQIKEILGYEIGVAITGHENLPLTIILTEGFGKLEMAKKTFNILKTFEGYMASINGATQIRAGVIRPEIIIPLKKEECEEESEILSSSIRPGTKVRIIRHPYFGCLGKVVDLPIEIDCVEAECKVRVAIIELQDGRRVKVPRANIELFDW